VSAASLAREVAALDAARTALAVGANASALRQIERYHRDFPAGELAADADVVAIEALAADGDQAAARRACARSGARGGQGGPLCYTAGRSQQCAPRSIRPLRNRLR